MRTLLYGLVSNDNTSCFCYIGNFKGKKISSIRRSLKMLLVKPPMATSEKRRLYEKLDSKGIDFFTIRLLHRIEIEDPYELQEMVRLKLDELILSHNPSLNIKIPPNQEEFEMLLEKRERQKLAMQRAREFLSTIKNEK